jgi:uncharacterized membrane protein
MKKVTGIDRLLLTWWLFIACLIACRIYYSGSLLFIFLAWNIFLAWIPYIISSYLRLPSVVRWNHYLLLLAWLLFFPNALYLVTDLIHLDIESGIPKWFDVILLFSSSAAGLMMAFISLYRVEQFLHKMAEKRIVSMLIILILFLGSFGVYIGRFLRWNSWDIISNPVRLFNSIAGRIFFPFDHLYTWGVTSVLTILFYLIYFSAKKLPGYLYRAKSE